MEEVKEVVEDLIEETRLRNLTDDQIERRIRKFTEVCQQMVSSRIDDESQRQQLIERLELVRRYKPEGVMFFAYVYFSDYELGQLHDGPFTPPALAPTIDRCTGCITPFHLYY